jgi:predicted transcriptional regulator
MKAQCVKDIMIPVDRYAVVHDDATILDAVRVLKQARAVMIRDRHMPRAVVVVDKNDVVIGQIGHLDFLAALEPKHPWKHDVDAMTRAGVDSATLESLLESQRFWQDNLDDACRRARNIKVADIMHPVTDSIDEMASIAEAIRKIVSLRAMRMLVLRGGEAVGIVRLADLFTEIADCIEDTAD